MNDVEHAVEVTAESLYEVTAESLYEAVARGLKAFQDTDWAGDIGYGHDHSRSKRPK
jgi:hypothetical protein